MTSKNTGDVENVEADVGNWLNMNLYAWWLGGLVFSHFLHRMFFAPTQSQPLFPVSDEWKKMFNSTLCAWSRRKRKAKASFPSSFFKSQFRLSGERGDVGHQYMQRTFCNEVGRSGAIWHFHFASLSYWLKEANMKKWKHKKLNQIKLFRNAHGRGWIHNSPLFLTPIKLLSFYQWVFLGWRLVRVLFASFSLLFPLLFRGDFMLSRIFFCVKSILTDSPCRRQNIFLLIVYIFQRRLGWV